MEGWYTDAEEHTHMLCECSSYLFKIEGFNTRHAETKHNSWRFLRESRIYFMEKDGSGKEEITGVYCRA